MDYNEPKESITVDYEKEIEIFIKANNFNYDYLLEEEHKEIILWCEEFCKKDLTTYYSAYVVECSNELQS